MLEIILNLNQAIKIKEFILAYLKATFAFKDKKVLNVFYQLRSLLGHCTFKKRVFIKGKFQKLVPCWYNTLRDTIFMLLNKALTLDIERLKETTIHSVVLENKD